MITVWTLFSWIWAFEHALQRLWINHKILFASDIDKFCKQTYFENYDIKEESWYNDVYKIDWKKYKWKLDILIWGSPCQSFSMVWKRKWLTDDRWNLIFEFMRIVKESQPKMFLYENVKWILNHDWWKTWNFIEKEFEKLWYNFSYKVLNARDFGIPQNRERVFVVWFRNKKVKFDFPEKIDLNVTMQDLLEDTPNPKYFLWDKGVDFVTKEKNLKKRYTQINWDIALCQKANQQYNRHWDFVLQKEKDDVDEKYYLREKTKKYVLSTGTKNFYSKPKTDLEIARPLLNSMHKMHRAGVDNYVTHNKWRIRKLTPKECLRLMWFLDTFKMPVSDTQAYKQTGNSIVVTVLMAIINNLDFKYLNND